MPACGTLGHKKSDQQLTLSWRCVLARGQAAKEEEEEGTPAAPPFRLPFGGAARGASAAEPAPAAAPPARRGLVPRGGTARIKAAAQARSLQAFLQNKSPRVCKRLCLLALMTFLA
jgi:hypothetical protein